MKFDTRYERKQYTGEVNSGELITEQAGYQPAAIKILNMIEAGERLRDTRMGYEFDDEKSVPDDYFDPTRDPGFDMADASAMSAEVLHRMYLTQKEREDSAKTEPQKLQIRRQFLLPIRSKK